MKIRLENSILVRQLFLFALVITVFGGQSADAQCSVQQFDNLLPDDGAAGDNFGSRVAITGTTAIVGARFDGDNGAASGSAYLFDTTTGRQIAKLLPSDGAPEDFFGDAVAISGTVAIVGGNGRSDSAFLFDTTTGQQIAKLQPDDGTGGG